MNRFKQMQLSVTFCALLAFMLSASSLNPAARAGAYSPDPVGVKAARITILTNAQGMTLYQFTADKKNVSTCTGKCAQFWPALMLTSGAKAPSSLSGVKGVFAVASRAGGGKQLTFNGSPLYTFAKDSKPGDMNGEGVGGVWWAVTAPGSSGPLAASSPVRLGTAQMLVTANGMTLYMFTKDKKGQSTCTGGCAKFWPPLLGAVPPAPVPGFSGAFGLTSQSGSKQVTYSGSPLYTFANDKKAGDSKGQGVGGVWWMVLAPASVTASLVKTAPARILVSAQGMTLYIFTLDKKNQSTCTGGCAKFWPPLLLSPGMQEPVNAAGSTAVFGVAPLTDGSLQLTFDGAPLYTFIKDKKPGEINGQGVGGTWWTVVLPGKLSTSDSTVTSLVTTAATRIMVTASGRTLYVFSPDKKNQSTCTGGCAKFWPPLLISGGTAAPVSVPGIAGTFGAAPLAGGARQLSYEGAPLYTFANDKKPGDMHGQGIEGLWWIAAPAGQTSNAIAEAPPAATSTATAVPTATSTVAPPPPASSPLPSSTASAVATATAIATATVTATSVAVVPTATSVPMNTAAPTATVYIKPY
jgi:predicted lipoprotein with Yx(FWY)xxD motif